MGSRDSGETKVDPHWVQDPLLSFNGPYHGPTIPHEKCQSFEQEEINLLFHINVYKRLISYITLIHMRDQSCGVNILVLEINLSAFCLIL